MALFKRTQSTATAAAAPKITETKPMSNVGVHKQRLLLKPLVTEKATVTGTYCFKIALQANKQEIAKEFKMIYGKTPRKVNILNHMGKTVRRGRISGKQVNIKKAIVYLKKGETIDVFAK